MKKVLLFLLYYVGIPLIAGTVGFALSMAGLLQVGCLAVAPVVAVLLRLFIGRKADRTTGAWISGGIFLGLLLIFTVMMLIASGNTGGALMANFAWFAAPFGLMTLFCVLMDSYQLLYISVFLTYGAMAVTGFLLAKERLSRRVSIGLAALLVVCLLTDGILYVNRPEAKYAGHGFTYMNGYSSTDLDDYRVYSRHSKLAELDHEPQLRIENEADMPVMDGAEACYPLYAAVAKAVYKDIDRIEEQWSKTDDTRFNGKIVTFTNSVVGFDRLLRQGADAVKYGDKIDLFFGARPSASQMDWAEEMKVELEITPIGREAFVFFAEEDNPVDNLTSEQVKAIYHGDITNWQEVGGKDQEIIAFQRPKDSGSQTMMEYFMGDVSIKEPQTYERVSSMSGVVSLVAQYANEDGALGYSFRYFLEGLNQEKGVKILSIDGVAPTLENIENGSYPLTTGLCLITRKNDPNPNVQKMIDFMLSEDGQTLVRETGYGALQ